jgi:nitric oxide reductase subunit B
MFANRNQESEDLSPWWRRGVLIILVVEFSLLIWISIGTYTRNIGPPIPDQVIDASGNQVFSGDDIRAGQQVFLKYDLMDNGTVWGHGAYLGPDFSAEYLHQLALEVSNFLSLQNYNRPYQQLTAVEQTALRGLVKDFLSENRYNENTHTLQFTQPESVSYQKQIDQWGEYFSGSLASHGLPQKTIKNASELGQLTAFFSWAAWATTANIPGKNYSYTNNFPYEPLVANGPSTPTILWSALSLIALLAGTTLILMAFGRFRYLGWHGDRGLYPPQMLPGNPTASERGSIKYFVVVTLEYITQLAPANRLVVDCNCLCGWRHLFFFSALAKRTERTIGPC